MNTEQLKQVALAATPGPWRYKQADADSNYMLIFCSANVGEGDNLRGYCGQPNAAYIAAANPAVILALLECVDALRAIEKNPGMSEGRAARAALQKLEAL